MDPADFLRGRLALALATIDELRAENDRIRAERDAARRVCRGLCDRIAAAAEVIGRRAYRKDKQ